MLVSLWFSFKVVSILRILLHLMARIIYFSFNSVPFRDALARPLKL